jgi:flagellar basal-body rod protein FlgF
MSDAMYIAATGALNYQKKLDVLANNIANINTVGFKEDQVSFVSSDLSVDNMTDDTSPSTELLSIVVKPVFSSGDMRFTGNKFDLALEGDGFFSINSPDGVRYTRNGSFTFNNDGILVTRDGFPVLGDGGEIKIDNSDDQNIVIDESGNIYSGDKKIGTLKLVDFPKPYNLVKLENTSFMVEDTNVSEINPVDLKVNQGFIELSNVNAVKAMTDMIETLRGYESYQKVIKSLEDISSKAINDVGSV